LALPPRRPPGLSLGEVMAAKHHKPVVVISSSQKAVRVPRKRIVELVDFISRREGERIGSADIAFVDSDDMASMNRRWLDHRGPTDVLSFDMGKDEAAPGISAQLVICGPVAAKQAKDRGLDVQYEILLYVTHGLLHLMGYEDHTIRGGARMHAREEELLREFLKSGKRGRP
jgi:probable rRNA maturation factor